jgi:hypothetical protein
MVLGMSLEKGAPFVLVKIRCEAKTYLKVPSHQIKLGRARIGLKNESKFKIPFTLRDPFTQQGLSYHTTFRPI